MSERALNIMLANLIMSLASPELEHALTEDDKEALKLLQPYKEPPSNPDKVPEKPL